jgi:serine/threonine protein phosphatase PrpC
MIKLKSYSAKTNQGPFLQVNEDNFEIDLVNKMFLLFDGFGGAGIGDLAVQSLKKNIKNFYTKFSDDPDSTMPFFYSHKYNLEGNALINSMHNAQKLLVNENKAKEISLRGGSSVIAAVQSENLVITASTGNCLTTLYRKGHLEVVNYPDSLEFLSGEKYNSNLQTTPLSGFGLFEDLHLSIKEIRPMDGDLLILMTDGVYSRINNEELKYIIEKPGMYLPEKIDELFDLANSHGNLDNQSIVFLQF